MISSNQVSSQSQVNLKTFWIHVLYNSFIIFGTPSNHSVDVRKGAVVNWFNTPYLRPFITILGTKDYIVHATIYILLHFKNLLFSVLMQYDFHGRSYQISARSAQRNSFRFNFRFRFESETVSIDFDVYSEMWNCSASFQGINWSYRPSIAVVFK